MTQPVYDIEYDRKYNADENTGRNRNVHPGVTFFEGDVSRQLAQERDPSCIVEQQSRYKENQTREY